MCVCVCLWVRPLPLCLKARACECWCTRPLPLCIEARACVHVSVCVCIRYHCVKKHEHVCVCVWVRYHCVKKHEHVHVCVHPLPLSLKVWACVCVCVCVCVRYHCVKKHEHVCACACTWLFVCLCVCTHDVLHPKNSMAVCTVACFFCLLHAMGLQFLTSVEYVCWRIPAIV